MISSERGRSICRSAIPKAVGKRVGSNRSSTTTTAYYCTVTRDSKGECHRPDVKRDRGYCIFKQSRKIAPTFLLSISTTSVSDIGSDLDEEPPPPAFKEAMVPPTCGMSGDWGGNKAICSSAFDLSASMIPMNIYGVYRDLARAAQKLLVPSQLQSITITM